MTHVTPSANRFALPHEQQRGHTPDHSPAGLQPMRSAGESENGVRGGFRARLEESTRLARSAGIPGGITTGTARHPTLGSALAGPVWTWAPTARHSVRPIATELEHASSGSTTIQAGHGRSEANVKASSPVELPMPSALLRAMAAAASTSGRRECDVWAEAAREWLLRHSQDDDPPPPPPAVAAPDPAAPRSARQRCWTAIDVLLNDLRGPSRPHPASPAALASVASVAHYPDYPAA